MKFQFQGLYNFSNEKGHIALTGLNLNHFHKMKCLYQSLLHASRSKTRIKGILGTWIRSSLEALGTCLSGLMYGGGGRLRHFHIHPTFHQPPLTNTKSPVTKKGVRIISLLLVVSLSANMVLAIGTCNCRHHPKTMDINFTKGRTFHYEWKDGFN